MVHYLELILIDFCAGVGVLLDGFVHGVREDILLDIRLKGRRFINMRYLPAWIRLGLFSHLHILEDQSYYI